MPLSNGISRYSRTAARIRGAVLSVSAALLLVAAIDCSHSTRDPHESPYRHAMFGGTLLREMPEVVSHDGVAAFALTARLDRRRRPAFFFRGTEVAPTIRIAPGGTIRIRLANELPRYCAPGIVANLNLHFHGLWSAPVRPGDEVVATNVPPNHAYEYVVHIDRAQPPGLYWYHPHAHGLTAFEVGNGMSGAIIVGGLAGVVPDLVGLREHVIILRNIPDRPEPDGDEAVRDGASRNLVTSLARRGDSCRPDLTSTVTINGNMFATIGIRPHERELLRVLNASSSRFFELTVDGEPLLLVSVDGIPLANQTDRPYVSRPSIMIPPGGRAEFIVSGGEMPRAIVSRCVSTGAAGDAAPAAIIGTLNDDFGTSPGAKILAEPRLTGQAAARLPQPSVSRTLTLSESGRSFFINRRSYRPGQGPSFVSHAGTIERWLVKNDTDEVHVFHVHQTHFVVESRDGAAVSARFFTDDAVIPPRRIIQGRAVPSTMNILVDLRHRDIRGTLLFHCHILDHEDGGMMSSFVVI